MALLHYFLLALLGSTSAPATSPITELGTDVIVQPNGGVEQNSNSNSNTRIGGTGTTQNSNNIKKDPKKTVKKKGGKKKEDAPKKDS